MEALSPVSIHAACHEDITEARPPLKKLGKRDNASLRRSLFNNERIRMNADELTCSTPLPNNRPNSYQTSSFLPDEAILSPIHRDKSLPRKENSAEQNNEQIKIINIESLGVVEADLRVEFQVNSTNAVKKNRKRRGKSQYSEEVNKTQKSLKVVRPSSLPGSRKSPVLRIEPVEVSKEMFQSYQKTQMRYSSVSRSNKTDMRTVNIEETPPVSSNGQAMGSKQANCDAVLKKKLQLCETSDDDDTDDDYAEEVIQKDAIVPQTSPTLMVVNTVKSNFQKNFDDVSMNSSTNKVVSDAVIQSFRDLHRKTLTSEAKQTSSSGQSTSENQSCRVNVPKKGEIKIISILFV